MDLTAAYVSVFDQCLTPIKDELASLRVEIKECLKVKEQNENMAQ